MDLAYQTIETAGAKPRSASTALQLSAVFGPVGLLYVSAPGALIIAITALFIGGVSWLAALAFAWCASMIWSLVCVGPANLHIERSRGLASPGVLQGEAPSAAPGTSCQQQEVRHRLGAPDGDEERVGDGQTWTYALSSAPLTPETLLAFASLFPRASGDDARAALSVRFGADGRIEAIALRTGEDC